jgi:hypothetical protein
MKLRTSLSLLLCLFAFVLSAQVNKIKDAGPDDKRINFTIVGDGYTAGQLGDFSNDCNDIVTDFFNEPPFTNYTNFFNVHTIDVVSQQSGTDHPNIEGSTSHPMLEVNTALNGRFDAFGIHRLLVVDNGLVFAQLAANYPGYDQAIIICNTPFYGGSGGATAVNSLASSASDLAIHEVGHSFQNLADEYADGGEAPNRTSISNTGNVKWQDWIGIGGVGEFVIGSNSFKPVDGQCMMERLNKPFCAVCKEQTIEAIYNTISPLESTIPVDANVAFGGTDLDFNITTIKPIPNTLKVTWELNGVEIASATEAVTLTSMQLLLESNNLKVTVADTTMISMKNTNYVFTYNWTITNAILPLEWVSFTARAEGKSNRLDWEIAQPDNSSHFLVERSADGRSWESIDRVAFATTTSYTYYDDLPLPGTNHYRIRAVDLDATFLHSLIREVRNVERNYFRVYPSLTSGPVNLEVFTDRLKKSSYAVVAVDGRVVQQGTLATEGGWTRQGIDLSALTAGTYVVRILAGTQVHSELVVRR